METSNYFFGEYESESVGIKLFRKGIACLNQSNFNDAYSFFMEGLDLVTCDCDKNNWRKEIEDELNYLFDYDVFTEDDKEAYCFCKAFILSYENDKKTLINALEYAVKYEKIVTVNNQPNEYANYVIGRILLQLDFPTMALHYFKFILINCDTKNSARINYRIGRIMEQYDIEKNPIGCDGFTLYPNGLRYLSDSLIENCSSSCCARVLQYYTRRFNPSYSMKKSYNKNEIIEKFINLDSESEFVKKYKLILNDYEEYGCLVKKPIVSQFLDFLSYNSNIFMKSDDYALHKSLSLPISRIILNEEAPLYILFPEQFGENKLDNPPINKHFNKGELTRIYEYIENRDFDEEFDEEFESDYDEENINTKYKFYNNHSDDVIDDVFDGEPLNTWNID